MLACFMGLSLDGIVDDMQKDSGIPQISCRLYSFFQGFLTNFLASVHSSIFTPVSCFSLELALQLWSRRSPGPKHQLSLIQRCSLVLKDFVHRRSWCPLRMWFSTRCCVRPWKVSRRQTEEWWKRLCCTMSCKTHVVKIWFKRDHSKVIVSKYSCDLIIWITELL